PNVGLGMTLYRMKNYSEALKYLVPQYNKRRESLSVTGMISNSYLQTRQFKQAIPYLEQYVVMRPDAPMVYFDLVRAYIYEAQYDRAMQFYAQNKSKFPPKGRRWNEIYDALTNAGHTADAEKLKQ